MEDVHRRLCRLCRCAPGTFVGAQLVTVDKSHLRSDSVVETWVSTKTDGDRTLLYFDPVARSAFTVDRLTRVHELPCTAHHELLAGTVLDCERVAGGDRPLFVVFDVLAFAGTCVQKMGFRDRVAHVEARSDLWRTVEADFRVVPKPFFRITDTLGMFWFDAYCKHHHPTDGVVLIDGGAEYHAGRHWGFAKWKPAHLQTVDFVVGADGVGRLGDCDVSVQLDPPPVEVGVWECSLLPGCTPAKWRPLKLRTDKDKSNDRTSYQRTLDALGPGRITLADIFSASPLPWGAIDTAVEAVWEAYRTAADGVPLELEFRLGKLDAGGGRWRVGVTRGQHQRLQSVLGESLPCDVQQCRDTLDGGRRTRVFADGSVTRVQKTPLLTHTLPLGEHAVRVCLCAEVPVATAPPVAATGAKVVDKLVHTYHIRDFYMVLAHRQELRPKGSSSSYQVEVEWRRSDAPADRLAAVRVVTSGLMKVMELVRHL